MEEKFIDFEGFRYWYEHRNAKHGVASYSEVDN